MSTEGNKDLKQLPLVEKESLRQNLYQDGISLAPPHQDQLVIITPRIMPTETRVTDEYEQPSETRSSDSGTIANVVEYSLSMHSTVEPFSTSNGYEYCEERASIEVELRVQDDGGSDRLTIQYDGNYLKLSDSGNGTYAIIMGGNRLPPSDQKSGDNSLPNYQFNFLTNDGVERAGLLKISSWYLTLDTNTFRDLRLVSDQPPADNNAARLHRSCENNYCMLYFEYDHKFYELKPNENGVLAVEEHNSVSECKTRYRISSIQ